MNKIVPIVWEPYVIKYYLQYKEVEKDLIDSNDLFGAMAHFRIARNFRGIKEQKNRNGLEEAINSVIFDKSLSSRDKYKALLKKFRGLYNKELISATSKILWFMDSKEDFIIYDALAVANLGNLMTLTDAKGYEKYFDFCKKWRELYESQENRIREATNRVRNFYKSIPNLKDDDIEKMDEKWFRMRVLDMYLWAN